MTISRRAREQAFYGGYREGPHPPQEVFQALIPLDAWLEMIETANELVTLDIEGRRPRRVTRFEAALVQLCSEPKGETRNLVSFINRTRAALRAVDQARAEVERLAPDKADLEIIRRSLKPGSRADWKAAMDRIRDRRLNAIKDDILAGLIEKFPGRFDLGPS